MNLRSRLFILALCLMSVVRAQKSNPRVNVWLDFTLALGNQEATASFSYVRNWRLGKTRRLEFGLGFRSTSYTGTNSAFLTAPATLARSSTVPFINVFSGHEYQNVDTLIVHHPFTNSLNFSLNAGYHIGRKWYTGVNIDLLGWSFGKKSSAVLFSNGNEMRDPGVKPASWNLLLTGDLDYGSLNSEFFVAYTIVSRWNIKALYQFYFTEYKTQSIHQTAPDGTIVYRFRNKANLLGLGVSYNL